MYGRVEEGSWQELKEKMTRNKRVRKEIVIKERKIGWAGWWDRDFKRQKRKVKKAYKVWKGGRETEGAIYTEEEKDKGTRQE